MDIQEKMDKLIHREETWWTQRAKIYLLSEGDKNTKFYHQKANQRRNEN